jgi:AcrR family transcriptional regulator
MTRPSQDSEKKLLDAGKAILAEQGFGGLSVRAVAARAGVNLGLLSYHFGGKEAFVQKVAQAVYEDFFADFSLEAAGERDPLRALRAAMLALARFIRDHRQMASGLIYDLASGNQAALRFARGNGPRHGRIIAALVKRCMGAGALKKRPLLRVMPFLMAGAVMPSLMAAPLLKAAPQLPFGITRRLVEKNLLEDDALAERVDLTLNALKG